MTHKPLISVIIPVYNVAPCLRRCVDSLLAQTYPNYELILVDDGSTDDSPAICDVYKKRYGRVRVMHQANQGVSTARNHGIEAARGEYISFVDADDWVEPGFLQAFAEEVELHRGVDLVMQGYVNHELESLSMVEAFYPTANELCSHLYEMENCQMFGYVWNKLFRRQIVEINKVSFDPTIPIGEDFLFIMTFISHCCSMAVVPFVGYNYFYPPGTHKDYTFAQWNRRLEAVAQLLPQMTEMPQNVACQFRAREFKMALYVLRILYHERLPKNERLVFLRLAKSRVKGNGELHIGTYEWSFWLLAVMVLYVPHHISDGLLMATQKVRSILK